MNYEGEKFLYALFRELYKKDSVIKADIKDGKNSGNKFELLNKYLNRIKKQEYFFDDDHHELELYLKNRYYDRYVIKEDEILDSYFEYLENAALELGVVLKYDEEKKAIEKKRIINAQKDSLDKWLDFLMKDANMYPMWIRYWIFQSVVKLGNYNNETNSFSKRSKGTINPFPELNVEALNKTINDVYNYKYDVGVDDNELCNLINTGNFGKIYAYNLYKIFHDVERKKMNCRNAKNGIWKEFHEEDWKDVVISLTGKGTGWCIAGGNIALKYLEEDNGKFDIYYTKDVDGNYTIPRACIRYSEGVVQEIRGVSNNQNLEDEIIDIVDEKVVGCNGREKFIPVFNDMKILSNIIKKYQNNILLTKEEINFIYELDRKIVCFGYKSDTRIKDIKKEPEFLKNICKVINDDREMMLKVIEDDGTLIRYASDDLKSDKRFIIDALSISKDVYFDINENLKNDEDFIIESISKNTSIFKLIDEKFKTNRDFLKKLLRKNGYVIYFFDEDLKRDKELVLEAFKHDSYSVMNISDVLKNDAEFMFELAKMDIIALNYIGNDLKKNKKFFIDALKYSYSIYRMMDETLKNDKEFLFESLKYNIDCYMYFSDELKNDKDVLLKLIKYDYTKFESVNDDLKKDKEFLLSLISENYLILNYLDKKLLDDKEFMLEAIKVCDLSFDYISDNLKNDREFMYNLIEYNNQFIYKIGDELKNDKEFVLYGVAVSNDFLRLINRKFFNDKDIMINAIKAFSSNVRFISRELKKDNNFLLELVKVNIDVLKYLGTNLKNNKEFILSIVKVHGLLVFDYIDQEWMFDEDISLILNNNSNEKKLTYSL